MEDIAFSDWPTQPVDIAGSNTWMPAYGFQAPTTLLDKEDFLGHPDAELFLHGTAGQNYVYLETIQEETSDDLRSDSDLSESRDSPVGWLATDSESGSVIRIHTLGQIECSSERELACPSKRRKQENLANLSDDELESLSRSSSLIQFESLEKQCQDISSSSPSVFSNFSYEDHQRNMDGIDRSENEIETSDYYRSLNIDGVRKRNRSRDSLFYNSGRFSDSDSSGSTESEDTLDTAKYGSCKSVNNLKTWRSYDGLHNTGKANKVSAENLSEDSGYGDQLYQNNKNKSSSIPNIAMLMRNDKLERKSGRYLEQYRLKNFQNIPNGFTAYDGEGFQNFTGNFGVSYQDLSVLDKYESPRKKDRLLRNALHHKSLNTTEFKSNFNAQTGSEPNLLSSSTNVQSSRQFNLPNFKDNVLVSSVPKDLNLTTWSSSIETTSIATKNFDLSTIQKMERKKYKKRYQQQADTIFISLKKGSSTESEPEPHYKREGSYLEAMENMVNMSSDDESKTKNKRSTISEFDKKLLKAISEQSLKGSAISLSGTEKIVFLGLNSDQNRNVKSTPNLTILQHDEEVVKRNSMLEMPRKSSLINRGSTSSENDDKTLTSTKSFSGSSSSKGVHFCPVVSEVNWRDDSTSTERGSSYSLSSTPEPPVEEPILIKPTPRRVYASEPELEMVQVGQPEVVKLLNTDLEYTFVPLRPRNSISQPNVNLKRHSTTGVEHQTQARYSDGVGVYNATPTLTHVTVEPAQEVKAPVLAMESNNPARRTKNKKLSGFFSRIASFRFTKKNDDKKEQKPKKKLENSENQTGERLATKSDYIYIPLKGPLTTPNTNNNDLNKCVSGKPPLPKVPPKIVGACVKRSREAAAPQPPLDRDIDSGCTTLMEPMGLLETDLDTEVTVITSGAHVKTRSLMNLGADAPPVSLTAPEHPCRPHKSMEFLLDKQNLKVVEPPENELQKGERVMSEHQLRVQRSLQKLTVPDWYKQSEVPREGFLLKKSPCRETRWTGTSSKTTSLSSLGSSNQSPVILSPTPQNQPFVRWSTSKLNSTASSPCASTRSSFNTRQPNGSISPSSLRSSFNYRQPYLGWRSQERLNRPRTPAERLANTLLNQSPQPQESPEIQSSIKEVTSAIVHYVSGLKPEETSNREHSYDSQETASQRSRSVSPRGSQKLCWLESSFVGTRPLDSPQTPVTLEGENSTPVPPSSLRLELHAHNDISAILTTGEVTKPSPGSTTLEDVLDSLLGLPPSTRAPSPSLQGMVSANSSPVRDVESRLSDHFRRRSEGNEPASRPSSASRRVSFDSSPVLRCRYSRCGRVAVATSTEGQAFKNCHNCTYTYCSRTCRRAHWEKHRKTCLFSRVGTLCRHVIGAAKEKPETLHHLSVIARRGFLSHGLGAVKCFFPNPEAAERFLTGGLENLGELTYICWKDLLPSEMGTTLYRELVKMCKNYNPDSKLVLYVSVCVISEAPAVGAVKWERQLVSRCAKMRLSKEIVIPDRDTDTPETLILTSNPIKEEPIKRYREKTFGNIQRHLRQRGVSLRRHYPEVFQQLQTYVDGQLDKFKAVTVYPKDTATGKTFMCIIMPESEPENLEKLAKAGVRVRTVDVLED